jgi:hypothetical protein
MQTWQCLLVGVLVMFVLSAGAHSEKVAQPSAAAKPGDQSGELKNLGYSWYPDAELSGTVAKTKDEKGYVLKVSEGKTKEGKVIEELKGKEIVLPADKAADCAKLCGKEVVMKCTVNKECKCKAVASITEKAPASPSEKQGGAPKPPAEK